MCMMYNRSAYHAKNIVYGLHPYAVLERKVMDNMLRLWYIWLFKFDCTGRIFAIHVKRLLAVFNDKTFKLMHVHRRIMIDRGIRDKSFIKF